MHLPVRKLFSAVRLYRLGIIPFILNRSFPRFFRYQTVILYDVNLRGGDSLSHPPVENVAFRRMVDTEDKYFRELRHTFPDHGFEERIRQPSKEGYVAFCGEEVAGYAWITYKEFYMDELNYAYPLRESEFFIYDCFVAPKYRGRGIYPAMLQTILRDYSLQGVHHRACIGVSSVNKGSRRGVIKAGFREFNRITYRRWFGREKWYGVDRKGAIEVGRGKDAERRNEI